MRSPTMRCAVEVGSPVRRPISAAVCAVRIGVKVSSTRTMRSVTESPDAEFAMRSGWHSCGIRIPSNGNLRTPRPVKADDVIHPELWDVEGDAMTDHAQKKPDEEAFSSSVVLEQTAAAPE